MEKIKDEEVARGRGIKILVLNANRRAYRGLSGFHKRITFGSCRPKLFARVACLSWAIDGSLATVKGGLTCRWCLPSIACSQVFGEISNPTSEATARFDHLATRA